MLSTSIKGEARKKTPSKRVKLSDAEQTRIRHQCNVQRVLNVNKKLSQGMKDIIRRTPFAWLLDLEQNIEASGPLLSEMLDRWDENLCAFQVGDKMIRFSLHDVALILGLRVNGEVIKLNHNYGNSIVDDILKCEFHTTSASREQVEDALWKYQCEACLDDFCRLYITHAFTSFLFPSSTKKLHRSFLALLDNLDSLSTYAWGKAVYEYLVTGLNRASAAKRSRTFQGNVHIVGCTAILQIWACEHLHVGVQLRGMHNSYPRILKWGHQRLWSDKAEKAFTNDEAIDTLEVVENELTIDIVIEGISTLNDFCVQPIESRVGSSAEKRPFQPSQYELLYKAEKIRRELLERRVKQVEERISKLEAIQQMDGTVQTEVPLIGG